jgi:hypothetical protein
VAVGDLNGDGKPDLVVTNATVSIFVNDGDGTFADAIAVAAGTNPASAAIGDFNGDCRPDLAVANDDGKISILLGTKGSFGSASPYPAGVHPSSVVSGDLDNDGKLDLAIANKGDGNASVLLGNGRDIRQGGYLRCRGQSCVHCHW